MVKYTPLYEQHIALGAEMANINGWVLPLHFGSQVEEHLQVRQNCGVFDASFMTIVDVTGKQATEFLQYVLANDVGTLSQNGRGLYTAMLNERGGIIDDALVYLIDKGYRLTFNACFNKKQTATWLEQHKKPFDVDVNVQTELAMLAVQGPKAIEKLGVFLDSEFSEKLTNLPVLCGTFIGDWFVSRTGYTGEDGVEIILPVSQREKVWLDLIGHGIMPIGMKARDTLRLEAGYNLYGQDMDEHTLPSSCNMLWTVSFASEERQFIGREALEKEIKIHREKLIGLVSEERGMLHNGQSVKVEGLGEGKITSTNFSPTVGKYIALARVPMSTDRRVEVEIKGKWYPMRVVAPKFVRRGEILI